MTTEQHAKTDPSKRTNGTTKKSGAGAGTSDFIHRVRTVAAALPSQIDARFKRNPYATIATACAIGMGIGIVASSRILRGALGAAVAAAASEITRTYLARV